MDDLIIKLSTMLSSFESVIFGSIIFLTGALSSSDSKEKKIIITNIFIFFDVAFITLSFALWAISWVTKSDGLFPMIDFFGGTVELIFLLIYLNHLWFKE